jgi:hypothetical protein
MLVLNLYTRLKLSSPCPWQLQKEMQLKIDMHFSNDGSKLIVLVSKKA